jgi:hypothetical protein
MTDDFDTTGSSSGPSSRPSAATGPGLSSGPAGPARRPGGMPTAATHRIALVAGIIAVLGTLAVSVTLATGDPKPAPAAASTVAAEATAQPTPRIVVDTQYVQAPAPTANPDPIVVPAPVATQPPVRIVRIVKPAAGGEPGDGNETEGGSDD